MGSLLRRTRLIGGSELGEVMLGLLIYPAHVRVTRHLQLRHKLQLALVHLIVEAASD